MPYPIFALPRKKERPGNRVEMLRKICNHSITLYAFPDIEAPAKSEYLAVSEGVTLYSTIGPPHVIITPNLKVIQFQISHSSEQT